MNLKFWQKEEPAGIAKIEAAYMMPHFHIHKNPAKDTGVTRVKYPSGNKL